MLLAPSVPQLLVLFKVRFPIDADSSIAQVVISEEEGGRKSFSIILFMSSYLFYSVYSLLRPTASLGDLSFTFVCDVCTAAPLISLLSPYPT
jgi:hypothetical protein